MDFPNTFVYFSVWLHLCRLEMLRPRWLWTQFMQISLKFSIEFKTFLNLTVEMADGLKNFNPQLFCVLFFFIGIPFFGVTIFQLLSMHWIVYFTMTRRVSAKKQIGKETLRDLSMMENKSFPHIYYECPIQNFSLKLRTRTNLERNGRVG